MGDGALTGVIEDFHVIVARGNHECVCMALMGFMMSFLSGSIA